MTPDTFTRDNVYQRLRGENGVEKTNKQCAKKFKEKAVVLERDQGYSVSEAVESLGISSNMINRWKGEMTSTPKTNYC
jgi:transposase-like protein